MNRAEFVLAATLAFLLFCMAVVMGCMPGSWIELAAGGTAGGTEGKLTDVWIPLGTWLDIGGVRFKVVFEEEPVTRMMQFTLILPPAQVQSHPARLALGERELRADDGRVVLTIKDYDFFTAAGITWGGRIKCDIKVRRAINPSMAVYSPELSFYRDMLTMLEAVTTTEGVKVWERLNIIPQVIEPSSFMAPITLSVVLTGRGTAQLKNPVRVDLKIDWFPDDVPKGYIVSVDEFSLRRYEEKTIWVYPNEEFKVVFTISNWVTPRADLYARPEGKFWQKIGSAKFEGVERVQQVKIWDSVWENVTMEFSKVWQAYNTLAVAFDKWSENARMTLTAMIARIEHIENLFSQLVENVGEAFKLHEQWTMTQLEMLENVVLEWLRLEQKPMVVIYAPQVAYAGVPNSFFVKEINCQLTGITVEDGSGVLWSGLLPFFTVTPRVPGSGLRLTVTYRGTGEWSGTYTKTVEIPFTYLTSITWENQQPVVAPPPKPVIQAWHLLVIGAAVFAVVLGVGLWRRR